ncbi:MAG: hypothetical protein JWO74_41 [Solirubrobacterales bacterium]|nr:hypothetical protein [Solirubrobacterales bacterium]
MTDYERDRHLTTSVLMEHWDNGVPVLIPIAGTPALRLRIDAPRSQLTLRAPLPRGVEAPVNALAHVTVDTLVEGEVRYVEISTTDARLVIDGYAMLMAVADRVQFDGIDPLEALEQTLATWQAILARRVRMSPQAEVGLFGELLVVRALLETGAAGVSAWRGGLSEEHDFGFVDADVEAKTTSGERRHHWIHGLTQLVETGATPLWLLSLQITRGGEAQGQKLPDLIDQVLTMATGRDRDRIEQNLAAVGWHEEQRELFDERWRLRAAPVAFSVDDDFPRLTPALLSRAGVNTTPLRQVAYEVDLTNRTPSGDQPSAVATIVEQMGETFDA